MPAHYRAHPRSASISKPLPQPPAQSQEDQLDEIFLQLAETVHPDSELGQALAKFNTLDLEVTASVAAMSLTMAKEGSEAYIIDARAKLEHDLDCLITVFGKHAREGDWRIRVLLAELNAAKGNIFKRSKLDEEYLQSEVQESPADRLARELDERRQCEDAMRDALRRREWSDVASDNSSPPSSTDEPIFGNESFPQGHPHWEAVNAHPTLEDAYPNEVAHGTFVQPAMEYDARDNLEPWPAPQPEALSVPMAHHRFEGFEAVPRHAPNGLAPHHTAPSPRRSYAQAPSASPRVYAQTMPASPHAHATPRGAEASPSPHHIKQTQAVAYVRATYVAQPTTYGQGKPAGFYPPQQPGYPSQQAYQVLDTAAYYPPPPRSQRESPPRYR